MVGFAPPPFHVVIEKDANRVPAVAVAVDGQWIALRGAHSFGRKDPVRVHLEWDDGAVTTLPGLVRTCAPVGEGQHLAHVDVEAVEGDWDAFLRYLGTRIASAAVA